MRPRYGNCITEEVTEIPRCCSRRIQSEVAWRAALRPFTVPAIWMAPPNSSNFSVSVVLPASGWEMMAKVLRCRIWSATVSVTIRGVRKTGRASYQGQAAPGLLRAERVRLLEPHTKQHRGGHTFVAGARSRHIAAGHGELESAVVQLGDAGRPGDLGALNA